MVLKREYVDNNKSAQQIARKYKCSDSTVLKYLRQFEIPIRHSSPHSKKGQQAYGSRYQKEQELEHKRERLAIEKIKLLRIEGRSYREIARILEIMGIPTKMRKGKWKATTVMKIYKRSIEN